MKFTQTRRAFGKTALAGLAAAAFAPMGRAGAAESPLAFQSIWINDPEFIGYFIAIDKGWYKEEGIDLTYIPGGPDVIPQAALLTGKADIALTSLIESASAVFREGRHLQDHRCAVPEEPGQRHQPRGNRHQVDQGISSARPSPALRSASAPSRCCSA